MAHAERTTNRTERLFALVLLLQNRPNLTSRELAEHFGVSRRTIFRDLRALGESGVPLTYAEGGGYEILEGYRLPPLMLTAREAATLLVGTSFMQLQADPSLRHDAEDVDMKIRSVLPPPVQNYIQRLKETTVLDPYWVHVQQQDDEREGRWYALSEAVAHHRAVVMEYTVASRDELTKRKVNPLGLVYYTDHWNLIAFDHLRQDLRNFRLDRIQSMHVLMERFDPPEAFDLSSYLREQGRSPNDRRIRIWFAAEVYPRARRGIPAPVDGEVEGGNGTEVTFHFENLKYVARWLLRFGELARVLEPNELRERLRDEAAAILKLYPDPSS